VELASQRLGRPVLQLTFQELELTAAFDGIWASASLLHVPRAEMPDVLHRLARALRPGGVLYASFKLGDGEQWVNGRLFNSYDEAALRELLAATGEFEPLEIWETSDLRPERRDERWLNAVVRKIGPV